MVGLIGIVAFFLFPHIIEKKAESEYDKYYELAQTNLECDKIETEVVCIEATEKIDFNTNSSAMNYSFITKERNDWGDYTYYDIGVKYKKNDTYDCTLYRFSCSNELIHQSTYIDVLVVGKGTTSNTNESFDFDKTVDECLERFARQYIIDKPKEYSFQMYLLMMASIVILLSVAFTGVLSTFQHYKIL